MPYTFSIAGRPVWMLHPAIGQHQRQVPQTGFSIAAQKIGELRLGEHAAFAFLKDAYARQGAQKAVERTFVQVQLPRQFLSRLRPGFQAIGDPHGCGGRYRRGEPFRIQHLKEDRKRR
jgi:hypothetical protein